MKKRSLVAALAMLMVSAIVLTSSTYAWFATGNTAQVSAIGGSVTNSDGSIKIATSATAAEADWSTTLTYDKFQNIDTNMIPAGGLLQPVSFDVPNSSFVAGSIEQLTVENTKTTEKETMMVFTPSTANVEGRYIKIDIFVKSETSNYVDVKVNGSFGYNFIYAALVAPEQDAVVYNNDGGSYQPVINGTQLVAEAKPEDSYVTSADYLCTKDAQGNYSYSPDVVIGEGVIKSTAITSNAAGSSETTLTLECPAGVAKQVTLYVWAEGNHQQCKGTVSGTFGITVDFTKGAPLPTQG